MEDFGQQRHIKSSEDCSYFIPYSWFFSRYLNSAVFADMERSMKFKPLKNHFVYSIYGAAEIIRENKNAKN